MPTLSILHRDGSRPERDLERYLLSIPHWELTQTSTVGGATKPYFSSLSGRGTRVFTDRWTENEIKTFHSLWPDMVLSSIELTTGEYAQYISRIQSRSLDKTPSVVRNQ